MKQQMSGAKDIAIIARMGAKMLRLYGNDPRFDGKKFLDYANRWGLKVVAGISDYPYEHGPGKCWKNATRLSAGIGSSGGSSVQGMALVAMPMQVHGCLS